jgi:hypothetical protein
MKKSAVIVHLDALAGVTPLVGGYLKAYALAEPEVDASWDVELYSESCRVKASRVIRHLVARSPDLVAFSVYTWNAGLVGRLLPALRGLLPPSTRFLLGGVEVMDFAPHHVDPTWENVAVCNGEGERTFRAMLLELGAERPDFERVGGITFPRGGEWCTTPGQPRIEDLTELASPWLSGVLDEHVGEVALFETNRGCPFACEFCFWGGAIGQKVYRQDLDRLRDEITYLARRGVRAMSIVDANFGILPRDVDLAEHIVSVNRQYRGPNRIVFNSSKVHPERVERISRIFYDAELLTRHVFSLQSMDDRVLQVSKRTSLERAPYREIQQRLNGKRMASIVELLWPMPGETLDTFKDGVDELLGLGAQGFLIYPLVWLNNTGYAEHTAEYGVVTLPEDDSAGGGRVVVETREVPFDDYLAGLRFALASYMLHDCRGLYGTLQLLNALGVSRFRDTIDAFAGWMDAHADGRVADIWHERLECFEDMVKYTWRGMLADALLNHSRQEYDRLIAEFAASQSWTTEGEHADLLRASVEYDQLCRPYLFLQTPFELGVETEHVTQVHTRPRLRRVRAPYALPRLIHALRTGRPLDPTDLEPGDYPVQIDHRAFQLFLLPTRTLDEQHWMCTHAVQEVARIEPACTVEAAGEEAKSARVAAPLA